MNAWFNRIHWLTDDGVLWCDDNSDGSNITINRRNITAGGR